MRHPMYSFFFSILCGAAVDARLTSMGDDAEYVGGTYNLSCGDPTMKRTSSWKNLKTNVANISVKFLGRCFQDCFDREKVNKS